MKALQLTSAAGRLVGLPLALAAERRYVRRVFRGVTVECERPGAHQMRGIAMDDRLMRGSGAGLVAGAVLGIVADAVFGLSGIAMVLGAGFGIVFGAGVAALSGSNSSESR
jgi:hypothetical protein